MTKKLFPLFALIVVSFLSSCELVTGIFKAGYYVGIFAVLAVLVMIVGLFYYIGRR